MCHNRAYPGTQPMGQEHGRAYKNVWVPWLSTCVLWVSWLEDAFHLTVTIWALKEGPTAFMRSWKLYTLFSAFWFANFGASIFAGFCFCVLTQFSGKRCVYVCPPNTAFCRVVCTLGNPFFLLIVVTILFQICAALQTRTHCPPYLGLLSLWVRLLPALGGDQAMLFPVTPIGLCRGETPAVIAWGCHTDSPALLWTFLCSSALFCVLCG